jgi:hypothetical protein
MLTRKLGYTEKDELYSKMIRNGVMSRNQALRQIELEKQNEEVRSTTMNEVFEKLGIPQQERALCISRLSQPIN